MSTNQQKLQSIKLVSEWKAEGYGENFCTGICNKKEHQNNREVYTIKEFKQLSDERFSGVLSIDMTDRDVSVELVEKIIQLCPKVECLFLNKTRFEINAWNKLFEEIGYKLKDLSIGNQIRFGDKQNEYRETNIVQHFKMMFKKCENLKELKAILFDTGYDYSEFAPIFKYLPKKALKYIYLRDDIKEEFHDCSSDCHKSLKHINLKTIIFNMFKRIKKKVKYLRIESNLCSIKSMYAIKDIFRKFRKLRALNLTFKGFDRNLCKEEELEFNLKQFKHLEQIQCLTVGFKNSDTTRYFLREISTNKNIQNINSLGLFKTNLEKEIMSSEILKSFQNLESLQLFYCSFTNLHDARFLGSFIISEMDNLNEIFIRCNRFSSAYFYPREFNMLTRKNQIKIIYEILEN